MQGSGSSAYSISIPTPPPPEAQHLAERRRCSALMRVRQAQLSMMSHGGLGMTASGDCNDAARPVRSVSTPTDNNSVNKLLSIDDEALSDVSDEEISSATPQLGVKAHAPSPSHKLTVPALPAIMQPSMAAVRSSGSASPSRSFWNATAPSRPSGPDAHSHSFRNAASSSHPVGLDASALPSLAAAMSPERDEDHNHSMPGRAPRADATRQLSKRRASLSSMPEVAPRMHSKGSSGGATPRRGSIEGRSISCESVHLEVPGRRSSTKSRRQGSKESSFEAFRSRRTQTREIDLTETKQMEYKSDDVNEASLARKYGIDALDVQKLLRQFYAALPADVDARDGCLSVPAVQLLICAICNLPSDKHLPAHLMEADWNSASENCRVGPEAFIAWWKNHQWCEEVMVPDSEERKLRQFCRNQGYELLDVERVKAAFDKADQDGSGKLEPAEFRAAVTSLQSTTASAINDTTFLKLWREVDADSSGTVELLEFAKWYLQNS